MGQAGQVVLVRSTPGKMSQVSNLRWRESEEPLVPIHVHRSACVHLTTRATQKVLVGGLLGPAGSALRRDYSCSHVTSEL